METLTFKSEFLPEVTLLILLSDHPRYEDMKPIFKEYGYGFLNPSNNTIIVDGEQLVENPDPDLLKFIEAHEISHILMGHDGPRNWKDELDADLGAYILLKDKNRNTKIVTDNFYDRHGVKFNKNLLKRVEKYFNFNN